MRPARRAPSLHNVGGFALVSLFLLPWMVLSRKQQARLPNPAPWELSLLNSPPLSLVSGHVYQGQIQDTLSFDPAQTTPMPETDRLAEPTLPESPTQVDIGRNLYYFYCMPCHGDRGQGLTDEWRQVWVEDHQNCWARGCHTGRSEMSAFPIPRSVPAVSGSPQALKSFQTAEELFVFLLRTQPPQRPGELTESEYWALTAFLLHENGRLSPDAQIGPGTPIDSISASDLALITLVPLLAIFSGIWLGKQGRKGISWLDKDQGNLDS